MNYKIFNEDCEKTLDRMIASKYKVDGGLTSPPYNVNNKRKGGDMYNKKYIGYADEMSNDDYISWQIRILNKVEQVLKKDGCFLFNISYGGENNETMWLLLAEIIKSTPLTIADQIIWKKKTAIPNNRSKNKITRICENVLVLCRKTEYKTFNSNKKVVSIIEKTGQKNYENVYNFVEAKNNDGGEITKIHKATYSSDFAKELLGRYFKEGAVIFDPFMGSGTTGVASQELGMNFIGSELGKEYFDASEARLKHN